MPTPLLTTKLFIPPPRPNAVVRPRLVEQLNAGLTRKLTLVSASAGFGKTTLLATWLAGSGRPVAWLSLDEGDNDPARFFTYLIAAMHQVAPGLGAGLLAALQAPQPPPAEAVATALLNEISALPGPVVLVLDDYHVLEARPIDQAMNLLVEQLPPQLHLVLASREDPQLPLARLRARNQLTELRAADLRFTPDEVASFLKVAMGLALAAADIAALERRTEGWIAGLQLAALSMQGQPDPASFISSFTGSHRFVLDYLAEEVLAQQPAHVQHFLQHTAILNRLCGPLCDALLLNPPGTGQATLETIERANLFIIPLDNERRWYRYHHLFGDLLRQRLAGRGPGDLSLNELHLRASQWYEDNGLELEAFHHAAAANDLARAERLIEGKGIPLHMRGAVTTILNWLGTLPTEVLNSRPSLWWRYGSLLLVNGHTTGVKEKLDAAETALHGAANDATTRNLIGRIAVARATLALTRYDAATMLVQSHRALEFLAPDNLVTRATAHWTLGYGHLSQKNYAAARSAFHQSISISQQLGATFTIILSTIGLGKIQEAENQPHQAAETYRHVLHLASDQPLQIISEAHLGLARLLYAWNDLAGAEHHAMQALQLARQYERVIDRFIITEIFLARLKLVQGDAAGANALLAQAQQSARQQHFVHRLPDIAAAQVTLLLHQNQVSAAAGLAQTHDLPLSQARVLLAQGNPAAALAILEPLRQQAEAHGWGDELLQLLLLEALAHQALGQRASAMQLLTEALVLAEPGGFIRLFVDEGQPMAELLRSVRTTSGAYRNYIDQLLAAFATHSAVQPSAVRLQPLLEPLSQRELEVLRLIALGLSNHEIGERLFLALDTVKGHNQRIFAKLQVQRRTEAVARARQLGLIA
ncbi:MAG: LuxR C-terminal-related transcriptional regulator [Chloroflexaceae bacterium]|jgi:LuxR family maltose regulon positive regulatory protein|nr:LuxR C-terminal-related transcriptional regulator [Chloroflexaceae bacterium]